jgi:tetratricopeptide (TPR) repeat protein
MKAVGIAVFIFLTFSCAAQGLDERIGKKACECYDSLYAALEKDRFLKDFPAICIGRMTHQYRYDVLREFGMPDTTDFDAIQDMGRKIGFKVTMAMVMNCESFFLHADSTRWGNFFKVDRGKEENDLLLNDEKIKNGQNDLETFFFRGMAHLKLKHLAEAKQDLEKTIALNNASARGHLYLGVVKEMQGDFTGAIMHYKKSLEIRQDPQIALFVMLAERKKQDQQVTLQR